MDKMMPLSENKIAEECIEYAILCLREEKKNHFILCLKAINSLPHLSTPNQI